MESIRKIIREVVGQVLSEEVPDNETLEQFYNRFKATNKEPDFLDNNFKNPDFDLRLAHEGGVQAKRCFATLPNKCAGNTFDFIKIKVESNDHRYFPVSGWMFAKKSTRFLEHFWIYDAVNDLFLDITPFGYEAETPYAYGGVVNKDINDEIANAKDWRDVRFLLGKANKSLYDGGIENNFMDKKSNVKLDKYVGSDKTKEELLVDFIYNSPKYKDLSKWIKQLIGDWTGEVKDLKMMIPKLEKMRSDSRSSREYEDFTNTIEQIIGLNYE